MRAVDPKQSTHDICGNPKDCDQQENGCDTKCQLDDIEQTPDASNEDSSVKRSQFQSKWLHLYDSWFCSLDSLKRYALDMLGVLGGPLVWEWFDHWPLFNPECVERLSDSQIIV